MATERGVSIVPLNSSNYATWKIQCRMALIKDGLWGIVDGSEEPPLHGASADKVAKFAGRRDRALAIIVLSVDPSLLYLLGDPTDPTEVWKRLEDNFQKKSWANKLTLQRRLYSLKLEDKDSVQEHIKSMTEIFDELAVVGDKLSEEDKVVHLLASLPDSFEMLVTALEANENVPSMEIVVERLLHTERIMKDQLTHQSTGSKNDSVLSTRVKESWRRKGPRCHYCKKFGHIQRYCTERAHNEKRTDVNNESRQERKKPIVRQHRVHKVEVKESTDNSDSDVGLVAGHALSVSESTQHDKWIIDSGATCHICNEVNQFTNLNTLEKPIDVTVGDGYTVTATKQGTVTFVLQSSDKSKKRKCILYDVLHVPQLSYSLFSVPKATEKGVTITFDDVKCCIFDKKKRLIMEGFKKGRLYQLNCQLDSTQKVYSAITTESLWHRRFCHLNLKYLQLLSKKKLVKGNLTGDMDFCVSCAEGKQHRSHFPSSQRRSKGPLDLVHSDVCGKIKHRSLGRGQYFLTFIDDFTRYIWVYILKHKSEVFAKFKEWKAMVEKATERQVKSIRTDNGGEYVSTEFQEYLKKEGIRHERTVPKNPEQNGVAERLNRTLVETVRTMLADSKLPKSFWAEAVTTACYLRNRSPTKAIDGLTPYQVWFGEKPKVDHLKIFGCMAHVHIPHDERRKLDIKSKQCIFLGYGTEVKGYRLYDQQRRRIIYSRDVLFEESRIGIEDEEGQRKSSKNRSIEIQEESSEIPVAEVPTDNVMDEVEEPSNSSDVTQLRRSQRTTRRPDHYGIWVNSIEDLQKEPVTVNEALNSNEKDRWKDAMQKEFESLEENQVWDLVELRRVVGSKWVFKRKIGENGKIERYKARLVAQGYSQKFGLDYEETFSPIVRFESIRTLISLAAQHQLELHQMDVSTAFLNGELDEEVFMRQPEGFNQKGQEHLVCKLKRSIYGLRQSPRCWNFALDSKLKEMGFRQAQSDPCLYVSTSGEMFFTAVYVDDILLAGKSLKRMEEVKRQLGAQFKIKDMGELSYFLGVKIVQNKERGTIWIGQPLHTEGVLEKFNMNHARKVSTPVNISERLVKASEESEMADKQLYQSAVGSLTYLSTRTRPDIAFAVSNVAKYCSNPSIQHWTAVKRIFRYLRGTASYGLLYKSSSNGCEGYSDADWAGDCDDYRSTSGYLFKYGNLVISWRSKKQTSVALSTAEAEYMALSNATQKACWIRQLLTDLNCASNSPMIIYEDNQSSISMSKNPLFHGRTKHIGIKYHHVREQVKNKSVEIVYCPTGRMLADMLTKGLSQEKFVKLRSMIRMMNIDCVNLSTSEKEC